MRIVVLVAILIIVVHSSMIIQASKEEIDYPEFDISFEEANQFDLPDPLESRRLQSQGLPDGRLIIQEDNFDQILYFH